MTEITPHHTPRHTALPALAALASLAAAAQAQTDLYIAEYGFNNAQISAVRTDGDDPRTLFPLPAADWLPIGLTFNPSSGRLTWMDSAGSSQLYQANADGSARTLLANTPGFGKGASLDALGRVYFASDTSIRRVNADGSGLTTLYTSAGIYPVHPPRVDAVNHHLYFGDDGRILRTNLDGGDVKTVINGVSQARSIALDLARRLIYWTDADTISDHVARANLDGSGFTIVADLSPSVVQSSGLIDMLLDPASNSLYYADELAHEVYRQDLDAGPRSLIFSSTDGRTPSGLVLSTGEPAQPLNDCDGNGIPDDADIAAGAPDCDNNGVPDSCQANPCPAYDFLLDQGSNAAISNGRALGLPSAWQSFQPFDVPAEGWSVAAIGLDGFTVNYHDGSGLAARLFPDDGSGEAPDESQPLAHADLNYRFNTNYVNWVYAPFPATLPAGRYWVRLEANDPAFYQASINLGFSGLPSKSRGASGAFTAPASPIALRLIRGASCPADFNADGFLDFFDYADFVACFESGACPPGASADFNRDGFADFFDYADFVAAFETGC